MRRHLGTDLVRHQPGGLGGSICSHGFKPFAQPRYRRCATGQGEQGLAQARHGGRDDHQIARRGLLRHPLRVELGHLQTGRKRNTRQIPGVFARLAHGLGLLGVAGAQKHIVPLLRGADGQGRAPGAGTQKGDWHAQGFQRFTEFGARQRLAQPLGLAAARTWPES